MVLTFSSTTLLAGLVYGVVIGLVFAFIAQPVLDDVRSNDPDDETVNSEAFAIFMKLGLPLIIGIAGTLVLGPLCGSIHQFFMNQETILGQNPSIMYILSMLILTLLLDVAVFVTGTPFPTEKLFMNTWSFVSLGLIIGLL